MTHIKILEILKSAEIVGSRLNRIDNAQVLSCFLRVGESTFVSMVNTKHVTLQLCRKVVFNFFLVPRDCRERGRFHGEYKTCVITNLKKSRFPVISQFLLMEYSFRVLFC